MSTAELSPAPAAPLLLPMPLVLRLRSGRWAAGGDEVGRASCAAELAGGGLGEARRRRADGGGVASGDGEGGSKESAAAGGSGEVGWVGESDEPTRATLRARSSGVMSAHETTEYESYSPIPLSEIGKKTAN